MNWHIVAVVEQVRIILVLFRNKEGRPQYLGRQRSLWSVRQLHKICANPCGLYPLLTRTSETSFKGRGLEKLEPEETPGYKYIYKMLDLIKAFIPQIPGLLPKWMLLVNLPHHLIPRGLLYRPFTNNPQGIPHLSRQLDPMLFYPPLQPAHLQH